MAESKEDKSVGTTVRTACKDCQKKTNHLVLKAVAEHASDEQHGIWFEQLFQIVRCLGCDTYSFRIDSYDSESILPDGQMEETETRLPNPVEGRQPVSEMHLLPKNLLRVYGEALQAMNSRQPVLAGIGIRAIVETICKAKNASGGDLKAKIDNLVVLGVL